METHNTSRISYFLCAQGLKVALYSLLEFLFATRNCELDHCTDALVES